MEGKVFRLKKSVDATHSVQNKRGDWEHKPFKIKMGTHVKVVMVSRFGDCGITTDLTVDRGYSTRVMPSALEEVPGTIYDRVVTVPKGLDKLYGTEVAPQLPLDELAKFEE